MDIVTIIADILLLVGFAAAAVFTIDYVALRPFRHFEPWWTSGIGIMLALLGLAISLIGLVVVLSIYLGRDYWGHDAIRLAGYALFSVSMVWLLVVYFFERATAHAVLIAKRKAKRNGRHK